MIYRIFLLIFMVAIFQNCRKSDYILDNNEKIVVDDGSGTGTVTWTKNNEYILEGFVFVNDGQTLTIEPGTVIRFKPGQGENASALIVARGGKIVASGSADDPIIFTSEDDDLIESVPVNARGLWGGLIILGNAPINVDGGEASIEGIPFAEPRGIYGGIDEQDNSGVLRYVSIRHGGTNIGDGNEINGLTLGGVGNKTVIDFVEIISNDDDGVEIFGGTVNLKHMVISGCTDDAFDYDLGWTGNGQFWLAIQSVNLGDNILEAGGGTNPVNGTPYSIPKIFNATFIGNGNSGDGACINFRDNAGGFIANSIIINNNNGVFLEVTDSNNDSYNQWKTGNLDIISNVFHDVAASSTTSIFKLTGVYSSNQQNEWTNHFNVAKNEMFDPNINWQQGIYLPNPKLEDQIAEYPESWFQIVDFKGAFGESDWIKGWTLLSEKP
ncbi:MAG: hypothetical protein JXR61_07905 [Prolixibacteraceae bacterium]|nr:hypothetical protein [Prolixibacteraceae bacterium]